MRFEPAVGGAMAELAHLLEKSPAGVLVAADLERAELLLGPDHVQPRVPEPGQDTRRRVQVGEHPLHQRERAQLLPQGAAEGTCGFCSAARVATK